MYHPCQAPGRGPGRGAASRAGEWAGAPPGCSVQCLVLLVPRLMKSLPCPILPGRRAAVLLGDLSFHILSLEVAKGLIQHSCHQVLLTPDESAHPGSGVYRAGRHCQPGDNAPSSFLHLRPRDTSATSLSVVGLVGSLLQLPCQPL